MIEIKHLSKQYRLGDETIDALKQVSLDVKEGEFISLIGPSGSGKTTLLNIICGLESPTSGEVLINGQNIATMKDAALSRFRAEHIGYVFQTFNLLPRFTVLKNVMIPGILTNTKGSVVKDKSVAALKAVGLERKANLSPNKLSGGERQRVAIARAIVNDPDIIFADEPTGNLDAKNADKVINLLMEITKERGKTLIMVTHNPELAARADRIIALSDGQLDPKSVLAKQAKGA